MKNERFKNLDIKPDEFRRLGYRVIDMITNYYAAIRDMRVFPASSSAEIEQVFTEDLPEQGQDPDAILNEWLSKVLPYATHIGSPRYFGFVNGSGTMIGTLAEALAASVNMNLGGWKAAPSATEIERRTISWIAELIGYPQDCGGLFTTGGTMANFTALETALRNTTQYDTTAKGLQGKPFPGHFKVYMSDHEGHISIIRVVDLLNLGRDSIRLVKSKEDFSMDTADLEKKIDEDIANGDVPLCVVAQVGSINVGVIDPLEDIAQICKQRGVWFHADGACGAVGALLPEKKIQYAGLELADSVTLDPHKWLYIPYDCGCVLVRDEEKLRRAFSLQAPYLRGTLPTEYTGLYYLDYGPEMSRGFRALKVWMSLKHFGKEGYRLLLSQNVKCVEYLDTLVRNAPDFEALHKPNLFMYCFRYAPLLLKEKWGADTVELNKRLDILNQQIADEIQISGAAFIMTSKVRDRVVIRLSVCSHRTTPDDIDLVFLKLDEIGKKLIQIDSNQ
jgi:aromatic-L-amino-acid/L-tryptophan decarboxylase